MSSDKTRAEQIEEAANCLIEVTKDTHRSQWNDKAYCDVNDLFALRDALALPPDPPRGDGWEALRSLEHLLAAAPKPEPADQAQTIADLRAKLAAAEARIHDLGEMLGREIGLVAATEMRIAELQAERDKAVELAGKAADICLNRPILMEADIDRSMATMAMRNLRLHEENCKLRARIAGLGKGGA